MVSQIQFLLGSDYIARQLFYRKRQWTCEVTGKTGLTYEEALQSESKAQDFLRKVPESIQRGVLQLVQFSTTSRTDQLVDDVFAKLKDRYCVGEQVIYKDKESRRS
jgi:hypothetical protein